MSLLLLATAAVAAVNAPRASGALPPADRGSVATLGAALCLLPLAVLAAAAAPIADALDLTEPTVRMGAGAVAAVQGLVVLCTRPPSHEPSLPGRAAALVPVAFPVLLSPALGLLAISGSLDRSAPVVIGVLAIALATLPAMAAIASVVSSGTARPAVDLARRGLGSVLGAALTLTGLGLVWNGTFDL